MDERDTQYEPDVSVDVERSNETRDQRGLGRMGIGEMETGDSETTGGLDGSPDVDRTTTSERGRLRSRLDGRFSTGGLLVGIVLATVGLIAVGALPLPGMVADLLGIAVGTFLFGVASSSNRYLEATIAGSAVGIGSILVSNLIFGLLVLGPLLAAIGLIGGAVAGAGGHYFGRDLRDGLTRDLE